MNKVSKKLYIEWLRIIAIIFVIYNHTWTWGCELYQVTDEVSSRVLSFMMYPLCKTAVPIFFMIAGANLLSKQESLKELYVKRVLRYVVVIILFGSLQYLRYVRGGNIHFSLTNWVKAIYSNPTIEPYWFLYLYLGFLLILPFLRKMVEQMEKKDFEYLFFLMVVCKILTVVGYLSGISANGYIFSIVGTTSFFYPIIGFGIEKYSNRAELKKYGLLLLVSLVIILGIGQSYKQIYPEQKEQLSNVLQVFTPMIAIGIFGYVKHTCCQRDNSLSRLLVTIGGTTFGIYLTEEIIRRQVEKILIRSQVSNYINDFVVAIGFVMVTFIIGVICVYVVKKLPGIRRLL